MSKTTLKTEKSQKLLRSMSTNSAEVYSKVISHKTSADQESTLNSEEYALILSNIKLKFDWKERKFCVDNAEELAIVFRKMGYERESLGMLS